MTNHTMHVINREGIDFNFFRANYRAYLPDAWFISEDSRGYLIRLPPNPSIPLTPTVQQAMRSDSAKWSATEPRLNRWFISDDGIHSAVIGADIKRYLGPDAWVESGYDSNRTSGYFIVAYRTLTSHMIHDLKEDTISWLAATSLEVETQTKHGTSMTSTPASTPASIRHVIVDVAEKCGWQIGAEKFLWDAEPSIAPVTTERGFLGRGSIGEVEEVSAPGFAEVMARKRIFISRLKQQAARERLQIRKEIEHLQSLDHEHIVKVVGCYQESKGKSIFTICALLYPSGDEDLGVFLQDVYPNGSHTETWTMYRPWMTNWFHCLASALAYMHAKGIHHEDIKPSNIIHRKGTVLFTDFSSSRKLESENETSTASPALASRMFAAPEAFGGDKGDYL